MVLTRVDLGHVQGRAADGSFNFVISEFWDCEILVLAGWTGHRFRRIEGTCQPSK